jgi:hypothetical protein
MKIKTKAILVTGGMLLSSCSHDVPEYFGVSDSKIVASERRNTTCPDLNGIYDGVGKLIRGDQSATKIGRREYFDMVFPISDVEGWKGIRKKYRRYDDGKFKNLYVDPDFAIVRSIDDGSVLVSMNYTSGPIGTYRSNYRDMSNFACIDGKLTWGGNGNIAGSSEWGKGNSSDFSFVIYKDSDGNLIHERKQKVHMKMLFGIPAGTAEYYSVYQFNKR